MCLCLLSMKCKSKASDMRSSETVSILSPILPSHLGSQLTFSLLPTCLTSILHSGAPPPILIHSPCSSTNQHHSQSWVEQNSSEKFGEVQMSPAMIVFGSERSLHVGRLLSILSFLTSTSSSLVVYLSSSVYPVCQASEFAVLSGTGFPN